MLLRDSEPGAVLQLSVGLAAQGRVRIYRRATVIDGTGKDRFVADVAVEGRRIVAIVTEGTAADDPQRTMLDTPPEGTIEIDAEGKVLSPGFIDMHAHSDLAVLRGADHTAKLLQGVTTEVIGQDGLGYAPATDATADTVAAQIAAWNGGLDTARWRSFSDFIDDIDRSTAGNVAVLVPQGNLRMMVVGHHSREATAEERGQMADLLGEALDAGAVGMSSGLTYAPGMHASTDELAMLCRVVAERGGYWAPHTRSYGARALEAYKEALDIGRRTGCPIHLTHATMNFAANRGKAQQLLALIDDAIADGVDVTLDTYPYLPGATTLAALLPSWLAEDGDVVAAVAALDESGRSRVRHELNEVGSDGFHGEKADWSLIEVSGVGQPEHAPLVGKTIAQIAADSQRDAVDIVLDLVVADAGATGILMHVGDEDNVRAIMQHPAHCAGSDGILVGDKPHPRGYGTFPRYLGHYAREQGVLTLEQAIQHLSGTPARRLGLWEHDAPRGIITEGAVADLVLFDPGTIIDHATFDDPRRAPSGIDEVVIGGVPVVVDGTVTGATPGGVLRRVLPAHRATVPLQQSTIDPHERAVVLHPEVAVSADEALTEEAVALRRIIAQLDPDAARYASAAGDWADAATEVALEVDPSVVTDYDWGMSVVDEAFCLQIADGRVLVRGATKTGVFRGVMALAQLVPTSVSCPDGSRAAAPAVLPHGTWWSAPAVAWRGVMIDVARHFRPIDDLRRIIDLLALHQMSVLHLHLTDDQGWRYEVPGYPLLTEVGARRESTQRGHGDQATVEAGVHEGFYTQTELRELEAYARERHITVVPEVELPGHVQAALAAYPELGNTDAAGPPSAPWERFGVNTRTLAPTDEAVAMGVAAIDALCDAFASPWIGIGGDEVPVHEWEHSERAQERMRALGLDSVRQVQPWFTERFVEHTLSRGRIPLAWDEVLEGDVPDGMEVLAWRGPVALNEALQRGIPVVACPDLDLYFDYRQSESPEEPVPVGPPLSTQRAYQLQLPDGVRGGQANVWTEHLPTRTRVDFALFPRLAASAERLWLGGEPGCYSQFVSRLQGHLARLRDRGVNYRPDDGPTPAQRRPGVPGKPMSVAERQAIVADLVSALAEPR